MRIATFNVENLFNRAKAMNQETWADGKDALKRFADLSRALGQPTYTAVTKRKIAALLVELGLEKSDRGPFVMLRQNRGSLVKRPRAGGLEVVANGRADWVGSVELIPEPVDEIAMRNTARVMLDIETDVLGVVEAESRPALCSFTEDIVGALGADPFRHVMLIDGNDSRGIDVGLLTGPKFPIGEMRSHVDDRLSNGQTVFSRDCAEFVVTTPSGDEIVVMVNHFKSKGFGSQQANNERRRNQAQRVRSIYKQRLSEGRELIAIVGDLNDHPESEPLRPLIDESTLKDVSEHPQFDDGGLPGTFGTCKQATQKIDFVLLSPALFAKVAGGGVFRKGMHPGSRPKRWEAYPEIEGPHHAASDHAVVWADIEL